MTHYLQPKFIIIEIKLLQSTMTENTRMVVFRTEIFYFDVFLGSWLPNGGMSSRMRLWWWFGEKLRRRMRNGNYYRMKIKSQTGIITQSWNSFNIIVIYLHNLFVIICFAAWSLPLCVPRGISRAWQGTEDGMFWLVSVIE